jgi:hypothetical protein
MTLRQALTGLLLGVMALTVLMACVEPAPPPPPPPPIVEAPPPPPPPPLYFVNVSSLALREGPTTSAAQIGTLRFNDEVELLDTSGSWARVVDVRRDIVGWASRRDLQPSPADRPRPVPRRRAPAPKEPTPKPSESPKAM